MIVKSQQRICEVLCEALFYVLTTVTRWATNVFGGGGSMKWPRDFSEWPKLIDLEGGGMASSCLKKRSSQPTVLAVVEWLTQQDS